MKAAIVGYATEGITSAVYWHKKGYEVTICDQNPELKVPEFFNKQLGESYLDGLGDYDVIVRSAGIHPKLILAQNPNCEAKITTNIEEFLRVSPTRNLIGVTGTKGKGTTSTLTSKMLAAAGNTVHLVGNIGQPPLEIIDIVQPDDWVVLELSSFQLEDFKGPSPHIALCLMMVPEHLNWHATMDEYIAAKSNLFRFQTEEDYAIYYGENDTSAQVTSVSPGKQLPFYTSPGAFVNGDHIEIEEVPVITLKEIKLRGKHNWQNACAAITAVWQITPDVEAIQEVLRTFSGLEHRIEFVRELDGVSYFDDSFATTPETSIAAMQAFTEPKVMILGGSDKGIPLDAIADEVVTNNVKHVISIGDMSPVIEGLLRSRGYTSITTGLTNMTDIVHEAKARSSSGDVVLLSTGCASFGLFTDYKDRGNQFKVAVQAL